MLTYAYFSAHALDRIEAQADRLLREVGLLFEGDAPTLTCWREFGARVEGERVYLDGAQLRACIQAYAPKCFTVLGRAAPLHTPLGQGHAAVWVPSYGMPNVLDDRNQRTLGNSAHYQTLLELADASARIGNTGHMLCVLDDVPVPERALAMAQLHLAHSRKPFMGAVSSAEDLTAVVRTARAAGVPTPGPGQCALLHMVNSIPPLRYKATHLACIRAAAELGEGLLVTSYLMLGAMAPVSVAGALAQGYAEVLAGMALAQLWRPGTPVIMGIYGMQFDMRAMQPFLGDPLSWPMQWGSTQLARRLGVPVRGEGGVTASKCWDAQAGRDAGWMHAVTQTAAADFVMHATGWLQNGRLLGLRKAAFESALAPPPLQNSNLA